jgi:NAD+ kinase
MKVHFFTADTPKAQEGEHALIKRYGNTPLEKADLVVALGGDGLMLRALHDSLSHKQPVFGMNRGSVGFLLNEYSEDGLMERLAKAQTFKINPLRMRTKRAAG